MSCRQPRSIGAPAVTVLAALAAVTSLVAHAVPLAAQTAAQSARAAIAAAEGRGAQTAADLATIRAGTRRGDIESARAGIRALGRLERPAVIPELMITLRSMLPEIRLESATAIGQAARGLAAKPAPGVPSVGSVLSTLDGRLRIETDPSVRAALCEAIGRLPYAQPEDADRAEAALVDFGLRISDVLDRLGIAKGFEAFVRQTHGRALGPRGVALLRLLAGGDTEGSSTGTPVVAVDPLRDARVRRLALDALGAIGEAGGDLLDRAMGDPDAQVRRIAVRWAAAGRDRARIDRAMALGRADRSPMVRIEAARGVASSSIPLADRCAMVGRAVADESAAVSMAVIDLLGMCAEDADSVSLLERVASDPPVLGDPRAGLVAAHALVVLSRVAPAQAAPLLEAFANSPLPHRRTAAAQARRASAAAGASGGAGGTRQEDTGGDPGGITAMDLRRLGQPRARIIIRDLGHFDVQLFTMEAPRTVLEFTRRAEAGAFDGTTIGRIAPNEFIEGPSLPMPATVSSGKTTSRVAPEVSSWPHVHGAVGLSALGHAPAAGRLFIDLVDNPRFDHEHAVFGQVLNGLDIVDRLVEGDVIDHVAILP